MKKTFIKTAAAFLFLFANGVYANSLNNLHKQTDSTNSKEVKQVNNGNKNIYTGNILITKRIIIYDKLTIDNAYIRYPHFWTPISFNIKKLIVNGEGKNRIYGWKFVKIDSLDGNSSKIIVDSGGAVFINNIKNTNLKNIFVGKYSPLVYLKFNQTKPNKIKLKILTKKDSVKKVIIENEGKADLDIHCIGKGSGEIFYKGSLNQISVKGKCQLLPVQPNDAIQKETEFNKIIDKKDLKQIINKYTWIPAKDVMYFIKYETAKNGVIIGVIFGVNLKTNKVIKNVPKDIAKATGYTKKIDKNGNIYYIYNKIPSATEVIINHKKYNVILVK